ncbi:MAG: hypothetical protein RL217_33 [Pseudomonadota bacterium]|jgi:glutamate racemase
MTANILIFDSGVGGLSILTEIRQRCAGLNLHYLMDNHAFPYGTKADNYLIRRILDVCQSAVAELQPDILVIACNTASTLALAELRKQLSIPVVGVVPAIKVAAELAPNGHIGLLATPATVHRTYTDQLIQDFAQGCEVRRMGSSALVQWAEDFICQATPPQTAELQQHLQAWLSTPPPLSHVVLGCTHFPLLKSFLAQLWPQVHWIDSGEAIARRVETLLGQKACALKNAPPAPLYLYWTAHFAPPAGVLAYLNQLGHASAQGILAVETSA